MDYLKKKIHWYIEFELHTINLIMSSNKFGQNEIIKKNSKQISIII